MRLAFVLLVLGWLAVLFSGCGPDGCSPPNIFFCNGAQTIVQACNASSQLATVKDCGAMGMKCQRDVSLEQTDSASVGCAPASCTNACFKVGATSCQLGVLHVCTAVDSTCNQTRTQQDCAKNGMKCVVTNGVAACM